MHSGFAAGTRFEPAEYIEVLDSSGAISFTAESLRSLSDGDFEGHVLKWSATISGTDLNGCAQKYERGELVREYRFHTTPATRRPHEFNQLDAAGLKHGWWTAYLDAQLAEIKNKETDTVYYLYSYYDHGYNVSRRGSIGTRGESCTVPPGLQPDSTGYILLNGEFKSLYKNGSTHVAVTAVDGYLTLYQLYYKSGALRYYFDYTKLYHDRPHTIFFAAYKKAGELKYSGYFLRQRRKAAAQCGLFS